MRTVRISVLALLMAALAGLYVYSVALPPSNPAQPPYGLNRTEGAAVSIAANVLPTRKEKVLKMVVIKSGERASFFACASEKPPESPPEGQWLDVYHSFAVYWLKAENGGYQVFDDRMSRFRCQQQLSEQGIECITGTDWQSRKVGRIYVLTESEEGK